MYDEKPKYHQISPFENIMPEAHAIGLGKSGMAAARLLKYRGWQVSASDRQDSDSLRSQQQQLASEGIPVHLGCTFNPDDFDTLDLVVVSPGVPWDVPGLVRARELGIETIGEMELAWGSLQRSPWVGITGTNGKTTTTALVAAIFQAAGFNAPACGNIGYAACELALKAAQSNTDPDWVIAEISSYQIESSSSIAPRIGIWTTFTPDHLNRHKTLDRYYAIKSKLLHSSQQRVLNGDDPYLAQRAIAQWSDVCWTSARANLDARPPQPSVYVSGGWVVDRGEPIVPLAALRMPGEHNRQNLSMAVAAARLAGIDKDSILGAIEQFPGVPHRLEWICTWRGIDFINDSKATNYDAAQVGLSSVQAPAILIAGGEPKEGDDRAWLQTIQTKAAAVLLIGEAADAFSQQLDRVGFTQAEIVETLERAIPRAAELARKHEARTVLLSPACASFDRYANFEQRGDRFRQLCQEYLG